MNLSKRNALALLPHSKAFRNSCTLTWLRLEAMPSTCWPILWTNTTSASKSSKSETDSKEKGTVEAPRLHVQAILCVDHVDKTGPIQSRKQLQKQIQIKHINCIHTSCIPTSMHACMHLWTERACSIVCTRSI